MAKKRKRDKRKAKPRKKRKFTTIYSDEWGEIRETVRYRGSKGKYVSEAYGKRWLGIRRIKKEIEQWRIVEGRRTEKILRSTPDLTYKKTYPGQVSDYGGNIYNTLEATNIFTTVSVANTALINIRGMTEDGEVVRLQGEINVGSRNQDEQLMMAVKRLLEDEGYRTNYSLQIIKTDRARRRAARLIPLLDMQITITLLT